MNDTLTKIQEEIKEYGSIWVEYRNDDTIENIVSSVINQVKEQVIDIINKYKEETDDD